MPHFCSAPRCISKNDAANREKTGSEKITFHKFPDKSKHYKLWKQWSESLKRIDPFTKKTWYPNSEYVYVCSHHFREEDFQVGGPHSIRRLKSGVVPSVFTSLYETGQTIKKSRSTLTSTRAASDIDIEVNKGPGLAEGSRNITYKSIEAEHLYALPSSPTKLKKRIRDLEKRLENAKKKIRATGLREKRNINKIGNLVEQLREQKLVSDELHRHLSFYKDLDLSMFQRNQSSYTDEMKRFCLTLKCYSPKAYEFVRSKFQDMHLNFPCLRTVTRWLSSIDCAPGFSKEAFEYLSQQRQGTDGYKYSLCSIMLDSMSIKEHIDWNETKQKMVGLVDFGAGTDDPLYNNIWDTIQLPLCRPCLVCSVIYRCLARS